MHDDLHALIGDMTSGDEAAWRTLAEKALRGADFDATLVRETADGIARGPVFFKAPDTALPLPPRDVHLPWRIRQVFTESAPDAAHAAILADLMGGVSDIGLLIDPDGNWGVAATSAETIEVTLKDVDLAIAPVHLEPSSVCDRRAWAESLTSLGATSGGMGLAPGDDDLVALAADYPGWIIASIDARCVHESGGTEAQEIAYAAAGLAHVIRRFIADGRDAASAIAQSEIVLAVDADIHLSISKLRAARIVLANVGKAFGVSDDLQLRAVTSQRMMTRTDPWTNLVRLSAAGFAGAVGAADAMTVLPATQALGRPDRLARRVARNMHILLQEESHAGLVANAAAGSYLHETLTAELAKAAWSCFQAIETEGGFDALESRFTGDVSKARDQLLETYRSGERALIGVSRFAAPDLREMRFHDGDAPPPSDPRFPPIRLEEAVETGDAA